jgi:putative DNA primase/helicase
MHNTNSIDFDGIKAAALRSARSLLQELVPNGRFEGREYVALNPSRADNNLGSFKINCQTGEWSEFATGAKGGDVISWYAYAHGLNQGEAARRIAEKLGVSTLKTKGLKGNTTEPPPKIYSYGEEGPPVERDEIRRHYYPKFGAPKLKVKIKRGGAPKSKWANCYRVFRHGTPVGWQWKRPANYRDTPYFGAVRDPKRIFWPEGEKDADTLDGLKLSVLTFGGTGDGLPDGIDRYLKLLAERLLIVATDNDAPGREHALKKAKLAHAAGIKHIRIFDPATVWPECPESGDISDWFEKGGGTRERLIEIVEGRGKNAPTFAGKKCPPHVLARARRLSRRAP